MLAEMGWFINCFRHDHNGYLPIFLQKNQSFVIDTMLINIDIPNKWYFDYLQL